MYRIYKLCARDLITLWGGKDASLHEYANKQWSGLFNGFYGKRWQTFIGEMHKKYIEKIKQTYAANPDLKK